MSDHSLTPDQLQALVQYASRRLGTSPEQLAKTVQTGGTDSLASRLPADKAAKFQAVVSDQARMQELLNSPKAQQLLKQLMDQQKK